MNSLKSVMVVGALVVVGYGVYVVLNNNPAPPTPDWIKAQTLPSNMPASVQIGDGTAAGTSPAGAPAPGGPAVSLGQAMPSPAPGPAPGYGSSSMSSAPPFSGAAPAAGSNAPPTSPPAVAPPANASSMYGAPAGATPGGVAPSSIATANYGTPAAGASSYGSPIAATATTPGGGSAVRPASSAMPASPAGTALYGAAGSGTSAPANTSSYGTPAGVATPSSASAYGTAGAMGGTTAGTATPAGTPAPSSVAVATYPPSGGAGTAAGVSATGVTGSPYANSIPVALRGTSNMDAAGTSQASPFDSTMATAKSQLDRGQLDTALMTLTALYDDQRVTDRQNEQLCELLDQLAGSVVYSRKSIMESPYRVTPGERLSDVAQKCNVPAGLLAKINGIDERAELKSGQELAVVRGPFQAVVNVPKRTMALIVNGRYAGRFSVGLGPEFAQLEGRYVVTSKTREHVKYDGQRFIELAPNGPMGSQSPMAIVGMKDPTIAERGQAQGTIAVTTKNADDLFDILSQGSKVTIHR